MAAASMTGTSCAVVLRDLRGALNDIMVDQPLPKREAARNVILALENARNVFDYNGVLSKLEDEIDSVHKERLTALRGMITAIQSDNNEVLLNIPARVQALISSLGLPRWQPCLVGINPQYVAVVNGNEFVVSFLGRFKYATKNGYKPFLTLGQRQLEPIEATVDRLTFKVTHTFKDATNENRDWVVAKLTVPFENGKVMYDGRIYTYDVLLGSLPLAAGKNVKVTYSWTVIQQGTVTRYLSPLTIFDGKDLLPPESNEKTLHILASEGSLIKKDTVEVISSPEHTKGQQEVAVIETTDKHVAVKMKVQNAVDQIGSVGFRVKFDEIPQIQVPQTSDPEGIVLRWGQEIELQPKAFKVEFDSYDGSHFVITGADSTKPYLKVVERNGKHFLVAEAPKDL